jgi:hypothetical protein
MPVAVSKPSADRPVHDGTGGGAAALSERPDHVRRKLGAAGLQSENHPSLLIAHTADPSTPWPQWYAERMLEHFATPPGQ